MNVIPYTGGKIAAPGIYSGVPLARYHAPDFCVGPSLSSTSLRTILDVEKSPAHFWDSCSLNPNRKAPSETEPMVLGRAAHHAILDEPDFDALFVVRPETYPGDKGQSKWNGNANFCKAWEAAQAAKGLTVITPTQFEQIEGMKAAIASHPHASELLKGGVELSFVWFDEESGFWLKSRPDSVPRFDATSADLKCVSSVSDRSIARAMNERGYCQQAALAGEAFERLLNIRLETFAFLFVEQSRPHCVRMESVSPEDYDRGWHANRVALRLIRKCLDANHWPGPQNRDGDGSYFNMSTYARERFDAHLERITQDLAA